MKILERRLNESKTRASYKNVTWIYNLWSKFTETSAAKVVIDLAEIKDHQKILEVPCGTGIVFEEILKRNPGGSNIGIDLTKEMLDNARKRVKKYTAVRYELSEGNVVSLKFEDSSFDILISNYVLTMIPEELFDHIASEFYRLLKPGGTLVISLFSFGTKKMNKIWYWIAKYFPRLICGCRPVTFKAHLLNNGFEIEQIIDVSQSTFPTRVIKARKGIANKKGQH